jgi:ATP-binding cassette subfamily B protein
VESGTHGSLLAAGGLYAELAAQQLATTRILEAEVDQPPADHSERRADTAPDEPLALSAAQLEERGIGPAVVGDRPLEG